MSFAGHEKGSAAYRRILLALFFAGIATFAQLYSVQGVLPLISRDLAVAPAQSALTVSAATIGLACGVLPWSWAADRFGRLPVMRVSLAAACIGGLVVPFCPGFASLLTVRTLEGIALGGVPAIAVTYLHDEVQRTWAAVAAGTYVSGTTIGGLFGRIVAAPVGEAFGWRIGVLTVALAATGATVAFSALTPAPRGFAPRSIAPADVLRTVGRQLRTPQLVVLFAQGLLLMGGFVAIYNYLSFRLVSKPFVLTPSEAALLFLAYLAGTASSRVAGSLVVRRGRHAVLAASTGVMIGGVLLTLAPTLWLIVPGLVILTAGFFGAHSVASGWVGARAAPDERAQASSLYNLFYYVGSSVIGWAGGFAFSGLGWAGLAGVVVALAVIAGSATLLDYRRSARSSRSDSLDVRSGILP